MQSTATFENTKHEPVEVSEANSSDGRSQVKAQRLYKGALVGESAATFWCARYQRKILDMSGWTYSRDHWTVARARLSISMAN